MNVLLGSCKEECCSWHRLARGKGMSKFDRCVCASCRRSCGTSSALPMCMRAPHHVKTPLRARLRPAPICSCPMPVQKGEPPPQPALQAAVELLKPS